MPSLSPRRKAALIIALLFVLIASLAIHGPSPVSNQALQTKLQQAADQALFDRRLNEWASVSVDGQVATLTGLAPSYQDQENAIQAVWQASWAGGVVAGGITQLIDETRLAYGADTFGLRGEFRNGQLALIGYAPDARALSRIEALADQLFSGRVDSELYLAPGGAPMGWEIAVRLLLGELARLDSGQIQILDDQMVLIGQTRNRQTRDAVSNAFRALPDGITAQVLLSDQAGLFENQSIDPDLCILAIETALGLEDIAFDPAVAELTGDAMGALNRAGQVRAQCELEMVELRVRSSGENPALDEQRSAFLLNALTADGDNSSFQTVIVPATARQSITFGLASANSGAPEQNDLSN